MHGYWKQLLSNKHIRYKPVHCEPVWFCVNFFSTKIYKKCVARTYKHGNNYTLHGMSRRNTCPLLQLSQNRNGLMLKGNLKRFSLPYHAIQLPFTSTSFDGDLVQDICNDKSVKGNVKLEDFTQHESDWMEEMAELKTMLKCSQESMMDLVAKCPRLRSLEPLRTAKLNSSILLVKGIKRSKVFSLLKSSKGMFLQVSPEILNGLFPEKRMKKDWYALLRLYLVDSLKGYKKIDDVQFLAKLLDVEHELLLKLTGQQALKLLSRGTKTIMLKEKVDFLLSEGISSNDIAFNLEILLASLPIMGRTVDEMKATVNEVTIKLLKTKIYPKTRHRDRAHVNKVLKLLDYPYKGDSNNLKMDFINNINQTDSIEVLIYLLDRGIDKSEIIYNPYVLGHDLLEVRNSLEKYADLLDSGNVEDQRNLLNRMVYDLEYGDNTVKT